MSKPRHHLEIRTKHFEITLASDQAALVALAIAEIVNTVVVLTL